jgi:hypothetical protein
MNSMKQLSANAIHNRNSMESLLTVVVNVGLLCITGGKNSSN